MSEPKTWKEQREEKRQQRERKIHYFPTKPFAAQPHLKNARMQRRIEKNAQKIQSDKKLKREHLLRL